ncbi:hypothetical protein [Rubritepida flocculans]|uniref:hypothetical protein n=1 Tax=Rubritepida flocculans TaxID=182403 RepID=UPI00040C65A8|nr:hypothetical protein [Rubritepida flocculans]
MRAALALLLALAAAPALAQNAPPPPRVGDAPRAQAQAQPQPRPQAQANPAPRPRPTDPRDRAFMGGGMVGTPDYGNAPAQRRVELAPRPNLDMEGPRGPAPSMDPSLSPTMINPRLPSRGAAADGAINQREQRLLQTPAPGARLSVPMSW